VIFVSTFVLIGQHRQAVFRQAKADHDFIESEPRWGRTPSSPGRSTRSPSTCAGGWSPKAAA